jgi:hypothetical protein
VRPALPVNRPRPLRLLLGCAAHCALPALCYYFITARRERGRSRLCLALSAQPRRLYGYARRPSPRCAARHDSDRVHVLAGHREPPATREATRHLPLPTVERTYRRVALSTSNAWNAEQGIATATTGGALLASHQCLSPTQQGNCRGNRSVTAQLTS